MARDEQQDAFEKVLSANLARIVDLIKFAETKNAALLTFCSFWVLASVNLLSSNRVLPPGYQTAFLVALPCFAAAALVAFAAFLPKLDLQRRAGRDRNLLFFADIADVPLTEYEAAARQLYLPGPGEAASAAYLRDLAREVAVNSRIARRKFRLFHGAAIVTCLAIAVLIGPAVIALLRWLMA